MQHVREAVLRVACVAGGLARRGKIRFLVEKEANSIYSAKLPKFKRKDWEVEKTGKGLLDLDVHVHLQ